MSIKSLDRWEQAALPTAAAHLTNKQYVDAELAKKANLASPAFTGTPTAPTAAQTVNNTQLATTAYVKTAVANAVAGIDTSGHAHAQADITGLTTALAALAPKASPAFTGTPTAPTAAVATNSTQLATTAYVKSQGYATTASPALTGTPTAPTAAAGTNTTQLATCAFVRTAVSTASSTGAPLPKTTAGVGQWLGVAELTRAGSTLYSGFFLPSGGTWAYVLIYLNNSNSTPSLASAVGVAAGGETIGANILHSSVVGFVWRIA